MITIALITFRETFEMLLIGFSVYTVLVENNIRRKKDLFFGASVGLLLSGALFMFVSFAGSRIRIDLHEWGELIEGVTYVVTGLFLFITAFFLHKKIKHNISLSPTYFLSTSIFAVGFLTVLREGIEIIIFTLSSSLLSSFYSSLIGFIVGCGVTAIVGVVMFRFTGAKIPHKKLLTILEWGIILLSFYLIGKGLIELEEYFF